MDMQTLIRDNGFIAVTDAKSTGPQLLIKADAILAISADITMKYTVVELASTTFFCRESVEEVLQLLWEYRMFLATRLFDAMGQTGA
jgi:hypothetical protein